jgi:hypothetical protein
LRAYLTPDQRSSDYPANVGAMSAVSQCRHPLRVNLAVLLVGRSLPANRQEPTFSETGQHVSEEPNLDEWSADTRMCPRLLAAQTARIAPQC